MATKTPTPAPTTDAPLAQEASRQTAVFAGGCFRSSRSLFVIDLGANHRRWPVAGFPCVRDRRDAPANAPRQLASRPSHYLRYGKSPIFTTGDTYVKTREIYVWIVARVKLPLRPVAKPVFALGRSIQYLLPRVLGLVLIVVWITSERMAGKFYVQDFILLFVLLGIIFFADALEVAYSLLRYKQVLQFGETTARLLKEIHDREDLVYEAREWLVTILIVALTLMAEFDKIYFPFVRHEIGPNLEIPLIMNLKAKTLFSLLFTTLPVLWLAQGPSKKVARACPAKMLDAGALVWLLIKAIGWIINLLGFNGPTEVVAGQIKSLGNLSADLNLKPSDEAYYVSSVQRYGYALHDLRTDLEIHKNGSCTVTQRVLYYAISRPCDVFTRRLYLASAPVPGFDIISLSAFSGPGIKEGNFGGLENPTLKALDAILDGGYQSLETGCPAFSGLDANPTISEIPDPNRRHGLMYRIDTKGAIPVGPNPNGGDSRAFAILAEFRSAWGPKAFDLTPGKKDHFSMKFECPCYRYKLTIKLDPDCGVTLGEFTPEAFCAYEPHWGERDRLLESIPSDLPSCDAAFHCALDYPFPSTEYRITWSNQPTHNYVVPHAERRRPMKKYFRGRVRNRLARARIAI